MDFVVLFYELILTFILSSFIIAIYFVIICMEKGLTQ
jgi:hypothetical protein